MFTRVLWTDVCTDGRWCLIKTRKEGKERVDGEFFFKKKKTKRTVKKTKKKCRERMYIREVVSASVRKVGSASVR